MNLEMDEEYKKKIRDNFLKKVKNTNWNDDLEERKSKRGRKPKPKVIPNLDLNKPRNKNVKKSQKETTK